MLLHATKNSEYDNMYRISKIICIHSMATSGTVEAPGKKNYSAVMTRSV